MPEPVSGSQRAYDYLHQYDLFAKPITLFFNGKGYFATVPGALCSCFIVTFFISFLLIQMIQFSESSVSNDITKIRNLDAFTDTEIYDVSWDQL